MPPGRHKQPDGIPKKKILSFCIDADTAAKVREKCMKDHVKLSNVIEIFLEEWTKNGKV